MLHHLLTAALLLSAPRAALAFSASASSDSFGAAEKAPSFLKFGIETKKLGLFTSTVTGYARKFTATGRVEGNKLSDGRVEFDAHDLDTDLYQRNDQMWNYCLGYKENPKVEVTFPPVTFTEGKASVVNGTMRIRGKEKPLTAELTIERKEGHLVATGKANTSFAALEIPDPSIGVASVKGPIEIEFRLVEDGKK